MGLQMADVNEFEYRGGETTVVTIPVSPPYPLASCWSNCKSLKISYLDDVHIAYIVPILHAIPVCPPDFTYKGPLALQRILRRLQNSFSAAFVKYFVHFSPALPLSLVHCLVMQFCIIIKFEA